MKMNKKGFTLIEMLVVIAIIAVLVSIVVPAVSNSTVKAAASTNAANLRTIAAEISIKYVNNDAKVKADGKAYAVTTADIADPGCKEITAESVASTENAYYKIADGEVTCFFSADGSSEAHNIDFFAKIAKDGKSS